ncbi:MAG: hypothetical protein A2653_02210 [Candidatus Zambryskibacteria bacterium RIFCSPHIGHO2_01_FULL_43_25]|uniref:Cell shape-determining protein MreC n=1 Tax=Candidatus Zambryskibacteria bacterium RIFCSPLOWO2_01_FULL_45_21 TaxID=1802761 RepID=A0A1G2U4T8_9BACT|nr:MAG: hypothetical protein A2653_02210 [Candidatus Zambryskibacteria bacterium RIFCSPHIGHO2_01_FULL_43_25]OHB01015.1 MAG: hypothetical protein A3E94_02390 [Candidatus Zambryskibacteria bacterium RIFCSPHIGHO2_12_FULL_44_12b]OHB03940.1 MAG: hypothetical protein A3B14_01240 [Candidatus Zambryskibacteria bacterium RIFCSPLOWO2_01_FULL_45_21]
MTTNYRIKSKKKIRDNKPLLTLIVSVVFIFLVFVLQNNFPQLSFRIFESSASTLWGFSDKLASISEDLRTTIWDKQKLEEENQALIRQIDELRGNLAELSILREENFYLKEMWGRRETFQSRLARVLSGPGNSLYDFLVIDLGREEGAVEGQRVFSSGGFVIGNVSEVFGKTSKVILFSSPGTITDASLERSGIALSLKGKGAGNFSVLVPKQEEVAEGDLVVLPGLSSKPMALVYGIDTSETDSFKELLLSLPVNIFELKWVEVEYEQ